MTSCSRAYIAYPFPLPSLPQPVSIERDIQVALVLGSGGTRGFAHIGVLEVLEEAGVPIDMIVGCSIGSFIGALYADKPVAKLLTEDISDVRRSDFLSCNPFLMRGGICSAKSLEKYLEQRLNAREFKDLTIPLKVVATNLLDGDSVVLSGGDLLKSVSASCAIPFCFKPIKIYGRLLADGAIVNPIPVQVAKDSGAKLIIAVDISGSVQSKPPKNIIDITKRSLHIANMQHCKNSATHADIIIKPKIDSDYSALNFKQSQELYQLGRQAAQEALPEILEKIKMLKACQANTPIYLKNPHHLPDISVRKIEKPLQS